MDFSEIKGQEHVKRAIEVALAGNHNMLITGGPGMGKTTLMYSACEMGREALVYDGRVAPAPYLDNNHPVIMTTTPCECGYYHAEDRECTCSSSLIEIHMQPVNDIIHHIDIFAELAPLRFEQIIDDLSQLGGGQYVVVH